MRPNGPTRCWRAPSIGEPIPPFELRLRARDGGYLSAEFLSTRLLAGTDRVDVMGVAHDVTEIRRAEQTLRDAGSMRQAKESAEAANRMKSEFLANMSHEIRTPMTAVLGFTDILLEAEYDPEARRNYLLAIKQNGMFLLDMINDLLDLTKVEMGKFRVEREPCSVPKVVEEVIASLVSRAAEKGLRLAVLYSSPIPNVIRTHATRLRQILSNLISNAVKFTDHGEVRVTVSFDESSMDMRFDVSDTGIGLSAKEQQHVFEAFYRVTSDGLQGPMGSGLGLAISRTLAGALGGRLEVQSEPGRGSTFSLLLPAGPVTGVEQHTPGQGRSPDAVEGPLSFTQRRLPLSAKVLLAEDNEPNRFVIRFRLEQAGAEVIVVPNGRDAIEKALAAQGSGRPFDVVLMDMQMPILDGYEATRQLRGEGFRQPILALTAYASPENRGMPSNRLRRAPEQAHRLGPTFGIHPRKTSRRTRRTATRLRRGRDQSNRCGAGLIRPSRRQKRRLDGSDH